MLCPWQEEALQAIFGNLDDSGNRIIELVYLEVPKKTGKTEFAAGLVLLVLAIIPMPGLQVYGAAAATRQAMNEATGLDGLSERSTPAAFCCDVLITVLPKCRHGPLASEHFWAP